MVLLLLLVLISSVTIHAQNPIALRASATNRDLILGAAVYVRYLRANADDGRYSNYLDQNYQLVVPGSELLPMHVWIG